MLQESSRTSAASNERMKRASIKNITAMVTPFNLGLPVPRHVPGCTQARLTCARLQLSGRRIQAELVSELGSGIKVCELFAAVFNGAAQGGGILPPVGAARHDVHLALHRLHRMCEGGGRQDGTQCWAARSSRSLGLPCLHFRQAPGTAPGSCRSARRRRSSAGCRGSTHSSGLECPAAQGWTGRCRAALQQRKGRVLHCFAHNQVSAGSAAMRPSRPACNCMPGTRLCCTSLPSSGLLSWFVSK